MDQTQAVNKLQVSRKTLHLVMSISIFSVFLCYSSSFYMIPNSLNLYFSRLLFSLLTRTLERRYMFLICNVILAFLAKSSLNPSPVSETPINDVNNFVADELVSLPENGVGISGEICLAEEEEEEEQEQEQESESPGKEEMGERNCSVLMEQDEEIEEDRKEDLMGKKQESADNHEDMMSGDELNWKIEEFIRKMKEEIRIEAQKQLIAAV